MRQGGQTGLVERVDRRDGLRGGQRGCRQGTDKAYREKEHRQRNAGSRNASFAWLLLS